MTQKMLSPTVQAFHDPATGTLSYVVRDPGSRAAAIIDPVLDYDAAAARTSTASADALLALVRAHELEVQWILETHAHADHLSAAGYLQAALGVPMAIGRGIVRVQERFKVMFGLGEEFVADGRQFDQLVDDGDRFQIGALTVRVLATPGHTDDSLTYLVGDAAFIGDTLFAPDAGTARTDFPGGNAAQLYRSIQRLLALPPDTRLFLCHDYRRPAHSPRRRPASPSSARATSMLESTPRRRRSSPAASNAVPRCQCRADPAGPAGQHPWRPPSGCRG